jgi:hypothetical protein
MSDVQRTTEPSFNELLATGRAQGNRMRLSAPGFAGAGLPDTGGIGSCLLKRTPPRRAQGAPPQSRFGHKGY